MKPFMVVLLPPGVPTLGQNARRTLPPLEAAYRSIMYATMALVLPCVRKRRVCRTPEQWRSTVSANDAT